MRKYLWFGSALLLGGCNMFDFHPYDGRITGETDINKKNIEKIETLCKDKKSIRFAFIGDTQRNYDETEEFVKYINSRDDIDFVIHGGDITDFGLTKEFLWMRDIMNGLKVPYVVLIGNHDCLANGEAIFTQVFGELNFSFVAGPTKFICLNTNALEYDYSRPVPDFGFINNELEDTLGSYKNTIFAMHVRPFNEQFNNNVAHVFQNYVSRSREPLFCMHAHEHRFIESNLFNDGIMYYGTSAIRKREFYVFSVNDNNQYEYEAFSY